MPRSMTLTEQLAVLDRAIASVEQDIGEQEAAAGRTHQPGLRQAVLRLRQEHLHRLLVSRERLVQGEPPCQARPAEPAASDRSPKDAGQRRPLGQKGGALRRR
jgi:hypothetical protein